jgi:hypothetical protein
MSRDEVFVTIAATVLGPGAWLRWAFRLAGARRLQPGPGLTALGGTVLACAGVIFLVLRTVASEDVRSDPSYLFMYVVLGLAWLRLCERCVAFWGISARDDAIERRNVAAVAAIAGALAGVTLAYAGGNIGNGPGWWVVVFSAALATGGLALTWGVHERLTASSEAVVIDRDPAAGLRLGAFLTACGLLFGRGVAGDWESASATVVDCFVVVPAAIALLALSWILERTARRSPEQRPVSLALFGVGAGLLYLGLAAAFVLWLGWPS